MAIQYSQTPGRKHQQPRAWKENAHQRNGQIALRSGKPGRDDVDQPGRHQHADQAQYRDRQCQRRAHRARHLARLFLLAFGQQSRVDRDKGRRQHAFAEQVLQKIGNSKCGVEGVRGVRAQSEIMREHAQPHQSDQAAEQNTGGYQKREPACAFSFAGNQVAIIQRAPSRPRKCFAAASPGSVRKAWCSLWRTFSCAPCSHSCEHHK